MSDTTGIHIRNRHTSLATTRLTHGGPSFDPTVGGLPWGAARDGEQTSLPDVGPGSIDTPHFYPTAKAPQVSNRPLTQDANVTIDEEGIHISDGAIFLTDYTGATVLGPAGFDGTWINFLSNGVYNGGFDAGDVSSGLTAVSLVGSAANAADYRASLSSGVPFWVIDSLTGGVTYGIDDDATYGRLLKVTKSGATGGTVSFFQDIPVVGGKSQNLSVYLRLEPTEFGVGDQISISLWPRDANHGAIGAELPWDTIPGTTGRYYTSVPFLIRLTASDLPDDARYLRVRFEVTLGNTAASHGSMARFMNVAFGEIGFHTSAFFAPADDLLASGTFDFLYSTDGFFEVGVGENPGGGRRLALVSGGVVVSPTSDNATLGFSTVGSVAPDAWLERTDVGRVDLYSTATRSILGVVDDGLSVYTGVATKRVADSVDRFFAGLDNSGKATVQMGAGGASARDIFISRTGSAVLRIDSTGETKLQIASGAASEGGELQLLGGTSYAGQDWVADNYQGLFRLVRGGTEYFRLSVANVLTAVGSFSNGWTNYGGGFNVAGYYKDAQGWVHLQGLIKSGTLNATAFTLPAGFRPPGTVILNCLSHTGAAYVMCRVDVGADGTVKPGNGTGGNSFVSLEGACFYAGI